MWNSRRQIGGMRLLFSEKEMFMSGCSIKKADQLKARLPFVDLICKYIYSIQCRHLQDHRHLLGIDR